MLHYAPSPHLLAPSPTANARRVVLVDDEPAHVLMWETILRCAGYAVAACERAEAALQAIARGCDCVLTDYEMPGMNGLELIRAAHRNGRPRFILLTGSAVQGIGRAAREAGASRVFYKPIRPEPVLDAISAICRNR